MVAYLILGIHAAQFQGETALIQRARRRRVLIWYMSMQNMHLFSGMLFSVFWHAVLWRFFGAEGFPRAFGCGASEGGMGTLRRRPDPGRAQQRVL